MAKYDDLCQQAQTAAKARGTLLVVVDGERGTDASFQCDAESLLRMPDLLDKVAKDIRDYLTKTLNAAWQNGGGGDGRVRPILPADAVTPPLGAVAPPADAAPPPPEPPPSRVPPPEPPPSRDPGREIREG